MRRIRARRRVGRPQRMRGISALPAGPRCSASPMAQERSKSGLARSIRRLPTWRQRMSCGPCGASAGCRRCQTQSSLPETGRCSRSAARLLSRSPIAMSSSACGSEGSRLAVCAPPSRARLWLASMTSAQAYETTNATIMATIASVREIPSTQRTTPVVRPCRASVAVLTGGGRSDIAAIRLLR